MRKVVMAVIAACAVISSCTGDVPGDGQPPSARSANPAPLPAASSRSSVPTTDLHRRLRVCRPADYRWRADPASGATASLVAGVYVAPRPGILCRLRAVVEVLLVDGHGLPLPVAHNPSSARFDARLGIEDATVSWAWTNWCGGALRFHRVSISVDDMTRLSPRASGTPRCDAPEAPSSLDPVDPWMVNTKSYFDASPSRLRPTIAFGRLPEGSVTRCPSGPFGRADRAEARDAAAAVMQAAYRPVPEGKALWRLLEVALQEQFRSPVRLQAKLERADRLLEEWAVSRSHIVRGGGSLLSLERFCPGLDRKAVWRVDVYYPEAGFSGSLYLVARREGLRLWFVY